ncbi:MAG: hypothetical protein P1U83_13460 [Roseovarius sp.]|nr:hypothetical protein [Roseovarius sp.]
MNRTQTECEYAKLSAKRQTRGKRASNKTDGDMSSGASERTNRTQVIKGGRQIKNGAQASSDIEHIDPELLFQELQDWELVLKSDPVIVHKLLTFEEQDKDVDDVEASGASDVDSPTISFRSVRGPKL